MKRPHSPIVDSNAKHPRYPTTDSDVFAARSIEKRKWLGDANGSFSSGRGSRFFFFCGLGDGGASSAPVVWIRVFPGREVRAGR